LLKKQILPLHSVQGQDDSVVERMNDSPH